MHRFIVVCLFVLFGSSALAQTGQVLIEKPPTYIHGESFNAPVVVANLGDLTYWQGALRGDDGKVRLYSELIASDGSVLMHSIVDPSTMLGVSVDSDGRTSGGISTTCRLEALYPVTLGKVYECQTTMGVDDRTKLVKSRWAFDKAEYGTGMIMTGVCGQYAEDDGENIVTSDHCLTPDGKWIKNMDVKVTPAPNI